MPSNFVKIEILLQKYFDGIYSGDSSKLSEVFHEKAQYVCATSGELTLLTMPEYFNLVQNRQSPLRKSAERKDTIVSIEMIGPATALAKVNCLISPKYFSDLLSLIKLNDQWLIIHKNFHYTILND